MRTVICACFVLLTFAAAIRAQSTKPWIEWTRKDVEKTLNDPAWGSNANGGGAAPTRKYISDHGNYSSTTRGFKYLRRQ
ncbi:MAG TPA: hypothetical protein VJ372_04965 [Pyrinomonadaceae bacterium]|nr:hypothetical protein [Pyrinomonadaceae bacterium]